jgi:hypothetical protein
MPDLTRERIKLGDKITPARCSKTKPCGLLSASTVNAGVGIGTRFLFNFKTRKQVNTIYVYKGGRMPKSGIVLRFCPFCGGKIYDE